MLHPVCPIDARIDASFGHRSESPGLEGKVVRLFAVNGIRSI